MIAVLFWGGSASLAKYLFTTRFDTLIVVQTRSTLSFILIALSFALMRRSVFVIERRDLVQFALLGNLGIAMTNFAYYFTVKESTVATAILIEYTAPVLMMVHAVFISKEETLTVMKLLSLLISLAGCFLVVSGGELKELQLRGWTLVSGVASAFGFAYFVLGSKYILRKYSIWTLLTYSFGFASLFWLFVNTPAAIIEKQYSTEDWAILWLFAIVSILIPHSIYSFGIRLLEASKIGIASTMEPVVAILIAYITLGEGLNALQIVGSVGVVAAILLLQVRPDYLHSLFRKQQP